MKYCNRVTNNLTKVNGLPDLPFCITHFIDLGFHYHCSRVICLSVILAILKHLKSQAQVGGTSVM